MLSNLVTIVILALIVFLFIKSIHKNSTRNFKNEIVSLGVLGTFVGIAIGLYHFDVSNIKESMPHLMAGLKTAFITSGVGIFSSIIISILKPQKQNRSEILNALESVVKDFNTNLTEQFGDNFKQLNESVINMITWQNNYKNQIQQNEQELSEILEQLKKVSLFKESEQKNIEQLIENLSTSSVQVRVSLEKTTGIVKEQMQLLLREANGKL